MSLHLPPRDPTAAEAVPESGSESSESDNDQAFSDWDSDGDAKIPCKSLFDETTLPTAQEVQAHDAKVHGFDLEGASKRIGMWYRL
jgi:protein arginine N-methyltransferase 3